jgi:hypothetical protein
MTSDPMGNPNLYVYVQNNPIDRLGPWGLMDMIEVYKYFFENKPPRGFSSEDMERWERGRAIHMHCTVVCWGKVIVGEVQTQIGEKGLTKLAKSKAAKWAAKMIKFAGTVSTVYSGYKAVECYINCGCPVN